MKSLHLSYEEIYTLITIEGTLDLSIKEKKLVIEALDLEEYNFNYKNIEEY
jgi:hypothetical protein